MCGIIGVTGSQEPASFLLDGLQILEYRGYDSAGVVLVDGGRLIGARAAEQKMSIAKLQAGIATLEHASGAGIGHTRWATHGAPTAENAHPHQDCTGRIAVVHNGIIENYRELKSALVADGHRFSSATDSEVVCHLVEVEMAEGRSLVDAVRAVVPKLRGAFALALVSADDRDVLVATRRHAPLVVGITDTLGIVASDIAALIGTTRELYQLEDDEVALVRPGALELRRLDGQLAEPQRLEIHWDVEAAQKGGYANFMSKEIHEQPVAVRETLRGRMHLDGTTELDELGLSDVELSGFERVLLVACGSSYHAALIARHALERWAGLPAAVEIASEFRYREALLEPGTLLVAISQSGETADTLEALREGKRLGATTIALTNVVDSLLVREADGALYTRAGPEIGVASTKCHLSQIALLEAFALHLAAVRGALSAAQVAEIATALLEVPDLIERAIRETPAEVMAAAARFAAVDDFYFLGRRLGLPIAMEGALKLKELAYVRAEAYPAGEMKHGPISLIEPGAVVVMVATRSELWEKVMVNIEEVRARGATIVALCDEGDVETIGLVDVAIEVPATSELLSPLLCIVPLQLFAYEIATLRGNDVDRPRNLAKVVTVE